MKKISAVMFDFDGTLVDTEKHFTIAGVAALKAMGVEEKKANEIYRQYFSGLRLDTIKNIFNKLFPKLDFEKYVQLRQDEVDRIFGNENIIGVGKIEAKPYAVEIIDYIKSKGIKVGVVSMSSKKGIQFNCDKAGLDFSKFDFYFGGRDCPAKPDPTVFLTAMKEVGVKPNEVLIVEDSNVGALAAIRSGATTVVIKDESVLSDEVLKKAHYIFEKNCLKLVKELI